MILVIASVAIGFVYGVAFQRYEAFPHGQIKSIFLKIEQERARERITDLMPPLSENFTVQREVPSVLLPLRISGIQLGDYFEMPVGAGAIAVAGNSVFVADRLGNMYVAQPGLPEPASVTVPPLEDNREAYLQDGDITHHEQFRLHDIEYITSRGKEYILASHEYFDTSLGATRLALSRLEISTEPLRALGDWEVIFTSSPVERALTNYKARQAGGRIAVKDEDDVFLAVGDYNAGPRKGLKDGSFYDAQDQTNDLGSIVRISIHDGSSEIVSIGHRNPQGLHVTGDGDLYSTEHGAKGGDELNRIVEGKNYGWPLVTHGGDYSRYSWKHLKDQGRHRGYEMPVHAWVPSIAVSNLLEIRGFDDRWDGDLLIGSLKSMSLFRVRMDGPSVKYVEPIWIGQRIRDIDQLDDGTIALWTDMTQLLFLTVDKMRLKADRRIFVEHDALNDCIDCHHFGLTNSSHAAPSLLGLIGRKIASDNFAHYSDGLIQFAQQNDVWTEQLLREYLMDPQQTAPGTSMIMPSIPSEERLDEILDILIRLDEAMY